jgi:hypothetical protein
MFDVGDDIAWPTLTRWPRRARDLQDQVSEAIDTAKCDFFLQRYA